MRHIRLRVYAFIFISALGIAACALVIVFGAVVSSDTPAYLLLAVLLLIAGVSAVLWIREHKKLKIARLIAENAILHIRTAVMGDAKSGMAQGNVAAEVFVSYFGILLDSRIIKFNQDGIRLQTVEFGPDYILLTYGTNNRKQSTRLLRPAIPREELSAIAEKFRYETGIVPDIYC